MCRIDRTHAFRRGLFHVRYATTVRVAFLLTFDNASITLCLVDCRGDMKKTQTDLLQGTLDLLVLKTLQSGPTHGWDIAQRIQQISQDVLRVGQGSLYPALHRLEAQGWIASEWGASENNRKAKYYKLTATGRKQLTAETETWRRFTGAVELILKTS
jgi:PadR family transcriptional regulator, regulatory protein PadR